MLVTGGGLTYASKRYYEVFSRMEDRFFCTVVMRQNFCVDSNIINKITDDLLTDSTLISAFLGIMSRSGPDHSGLELYKMFVHRMATLHGTELAFQLMESLASTKRKDAARQSKVGTHVMCVCVCGMLCVWHVHTHNSYTYVGSAWANEP